MLVVEGEGTGSPGLTASSALTLMTAGALVSLSEPGMGMDAARAEARGAAAGLSVVLLSFALALAEVGAGDPALGDGAPPFFPPCPCPCPPFCSPFAPAGGAVDAPHPPLNLC